MAKRKKSKKTRTFYAGKLTKKSRSTLAHYREARKSFVKKKRSESASKGWQTRRANERKRSAAARKGWETRRQRERERERKRTAKKPARKKLPPQEWVVSADYQPGRRSHAHGAVALQLHIKAPTSASSDDVANRFRDWLNRGTLPKGFSIRQIEWGREVGVWENGSEDEDEIADVWETLSRIPFRTDGKAQKAQ